MAPNMLKSFKNLKKLFPNLNHITCLTHAINRVCETIRDHNEDLNER